MDLEVRGVSKAYGGTRAVNGVTFRLPSGKILALLGPSGCGKTTTLKVISGLVSPDSGMVLFDGEDVTGLPPRERDIGMVFQNLALFPHLTVEENVAFPLEARGVSDSVARDRVRQVMDMVELDGLERRYPHELSGGQQQRVAIGRAISSNAKLLLLDEPLASLDPALKSEVSEVIRKVQRELRVTTVYVTHDQSEAILMSDLLAVMFEGQLDAFGETPIVYESPPTQSSASFLGATNQLPCTIEGVLEHEVMVSIGGRSVGVTKPIWWRGTGNEARLLFRPEDAKVVAQGHGVVRGKLVGLMYSGSRVVARVQTDYWKVECRGNTSRAYSALSSMLGKDVGIRINMERTILF